MMRNLRWLLMAASTGFLILLLFSVACNPDKGRGRWGRSAWIGAWENTSATDGITKFVVSVEDAGYKVEMWGKCTPSDCYWGKVAGEIPDLATDHIRTTWVTTFSIVQVDLTLNSDNTVELRSKTRFTDQSDRSDYEMCGLNSEVHV